MPNAEMTKLVVDLQVNGDDPVAVTSTLALSVRCFLQSAAHEPKP